MVDYVEDFDALTIGDEITSDGWSQSGDKHWKVNDAQYNSGTQSLKGTCLNSEHCIVSLTKDMAAGDISFYWYTSCAGISYARLNFRIDGVLKDYIYGNPWPWTQKTYTVTAGEHTLEWDFYRYPTGMGGSNAGWIDDIVVPLAVASVTGTLAIAEQDDTASIAGSFPFLGTMPIDEQGDSAAISGTVTVFGALQISETNDIASIYCAQGNIGVFQATEGSDSCALNAYHLWPSIRGTIQYTVYKVTLSYTGLSDYDVPISYWSCNKQSTGLNYFNCSVPNAYAHEAAVVARAAGNIRVSKGEVYADSSVNWAVIMSVPLQQISVGYGESDAMLTLGGNSQKLVTPAKTVALSGVSYRSETNGSVRLRGDVDLFAEVGDTITYGSDSFIANSITYSVTANGQAFMEVAA